MLEEWKNGSDPDFAIIESSSGNFIGICGLIDLNSRHQTAEIHILIGEESGRGKGYGTEAMKLLIAYGFDYLNLRNIMLRVFSFNENAIACYKKLGFRVMGKRRQSYYGNGGFCDEIYMDLLKEEYAGK